MMNLWNQAATFASNAHRNQTRNDGTPYFSHCVRVAMTIAIHFEEQDEAILAAALLHDTIEDCDVDYDDILDLCGAEVADFVAVLTKDMRLEESIREVAYDKQLEEGPWQCRLIKLADVYDNFSDADTERVKIKMESNAVRILELTKHDEALQPARAMLKALLQRNPAC